MFMEPGYVWGLVGGEAPSSEQGKGPHQDTCKRVGPLGTRLSGPAKEVGNGPSFPPSLCARNKGLLWPQNNQVQDEQVK